jgi:hypothetical protein
MMWLSRARTYIGHSPVPIWPVTSISNIYVFVVVTVQWEAARWDFLNRPDTGMCQQYDELAESWLQE